MEQLLNSSANETIVDVNSNNFMQEVIEFSSKQPVVVQFWAPWCGPCKQLAPLLEKVVNETGNVKLAKVNIDENQEIAAQMRVQSVPTVYGIVDGKPVDGFAGAQPESELRKFIKKLIENTPGKVDISPLLLEANKNINEKKYEEALNIFNEVLNIKPDSVEAISGLIKTNVFLKNFDLVKEIINSLEKDLLEDKIIKEAIVSLELSEKANSNAGELNSLKDEYEKNKNNLDNVYKLALALYAEDKMQDSMELLIESIKIDKTWNDGAAQKQLLEMFSALGFDNSDVIKYRKKLSSILFS